MPLSAQGVQNVKSILDGVTSEGATGLSGVVFVAVDKSGNTLVEHAAGTKSIDSKDPVDLDTTFWIASMTKLVTTIAVLQLVEKGVLSLDDPESVKKYAPEIGKKKVYADGITPAEQENPVTLRQLLVHTAGFGYSFIDPRVPVDEFKGDINPILESPMVNQPGKIWEYGINIDWAGIIVERATSSKLGTYFQTHIFEPLSLPPDAFSFIPTPAQKQNLASLHQRSPTDSSLAATQHLWADALPNANPDTFFHSGGAGLFAQPSAYAQILATLVNNGTSPRTGAQILTKQTVDEMFTNQIPDQPDFARGAPPPPPKPLLANPLTDIYPQKGNPPQGWGVSWFLTLAPGETGRGANTAWWAGLANLFYWADREKGVAGVLATQVLPFGDQKVVETWFAAEKAVYDGLE